MTMRNVSRAHNANCPTFNADFSSSSAYLYGLIMDIALAVSIFALSLVRLIKGLISQLKFI